MIRRALLTALSCSLVAACGGATVGTPSGVTADGGGDANVPNVDANLPSAIEGSYDVTFHDESITPGPGGPTQPPTQPSSIGKSARLDLRANASGGYDAVITPRWGDPASFTVAVTPRALTLSGGTATVRGEGGADDAWTAITLARSPAGNLDGAFAASGKEYVNQGDVIWTNDASSNGTLTSDVTLPETKPTLSSYEGPPSGLLPWDPIRVRAAEPVDAKALAAAFSIGSAGGAITTAWSVEGGTASADWAGAIQVKGLLTSWDGALAQTPSLATASLVDRAGNASLAGVAPLTLLPLFTNRTSESFDSDSITVAYWGDSGGLGFLGGLTGSDPSCEQGGCVKMGSFQDTVCGAPRIGIAGRLAVPGAVNVHVRYRVLVASTLTPPNQPPQVSEVAFAVDAASPGLDAKTTNAMVQSSDLAPLSSPMFGMSWATSWSTLDAPVPALGAMVGFTVRAGSNPSQPNGCGGPAPPPIDTIVLIDSVTAS